MKRAQRWSETDLQLATTRTGAPGAARAARPATPVAPLPPVAKAKAGQVATARTPAKPKSARKERLERVIASVRTARTSGSFIPGQHLELVFEGALCLSPNELFALHHFERARYRNCWHDAVANAVLAVTGRVHRAALFDRFEIAFVRRSTRLCDTDALAGYGKAPIDGLRYAGVIKDDTPDCFLNFSRLEQSTGRPRVLIAAIAAPAGAA